MPLLLALLILLGAWQAQQWWQLRPSRQPDGVLAPTEPAQSAVGDEEPEWVLDGHTLIPRAHYRLQARLLGRRPYRLGREAGLSPLDFALGWGAMSDNRVLQALDIRQRNRYFWLRWPGDPPLPADQLLRQAANTHLIPADESVRRSLARMRPGQVVSLSGLLVDVRAADGWRWNTSLTRSDTGAGACELFWVRSASVALRGT